MIGLDTNVLVRFFGQDDELQQKQSEELLGSLSGAEPGFVALVALQELIWVMTSVYGFKRNRVIGVLDHLLSRNEIVVERADTVRAALQLFRLGKADFPDCLISASARAAGCTKTVTFDRIAARDAAMELLE